MQAATVDVKVDLFIRWYDKFFDQARYAKLPACWLADAHTAGTL